VYSATRKQHMTGYLQRPDRRGSGGSDRFVCRRAPRSMELSRIWTRGA